VQGRKRNITLSLPPELVRDAKVLAAKQNTSMNALVRESLERIVQAEDEYERAAQRIVAAAERGLYRLPKLKWRRSDLYE
jgi:predicted transcriptional regulator